MQSLKGCKIRWFINKKQHQRQKQLILKQIAAEPIDQINYHFLTPIPVFSNMPIRFWQTGKSLKQLCPELEGVALSYSGERLFSQRALFGGAQLVITDPA